MSQSQLTKAPSPHSSLLFFIVAFFLVWSLRATIFYSFDGMFQSDWSRMAYSNLMKFLIWVVPAFAYVKLVERGDAWQALKLTGPVRWRGLWLNLAVAALFFVTVVIFERFASGRTPASFMEADWSERGRALALIAISPVLEEILFRGFLLWQFAARMAFWKANLLTSILFVLIHWPYWLWSGGPSAGLIVLSGAILMLSLLLGLLVKWSNSIWPAAGAHIVNNYLSHFLRP